MCVFAGKAACDEVNRPEGVCLGLSGLKFREKLLSRCYVPSQSNELYVCSGREEMKLSAGLWRIAPQQIMSNCDIKANVPQKRIRIISPVWKPYCSKVN